MLDTKRHVIWQCLPLLLCLVLGLSACSAFTPESPPISDSVMVEVLAELHLADARAQLRFDSPPAPRDSILATYGLDTTSFNETMRYYYDHPAEYVILYTALLDRLNSERQPQ